MENGKGSRPEGIFRPFQNLQAMLENSSAKLASPPVEKAAKSCLKTLPASNKGLKSDPTAGQPAAENEAALFMEAMADVSPIARDNRIVNDITSCPPKKTEKASKDNALQQLTQLVESGQGFVVADTSEYIEGIGHNVNPGIAKRLHRGDFSIQSHIDLHGLGVEDARETFEKFLKESVATGKRAVLIIHGRGLSSPAEPVLKTKVVKWLTCGPWRKWIIAFTSARSFDGGAGATYVLLRERPVTRAKRKNKKLRGQRGLIWN